MAQTTLDTYGQIDILVNNVGYLQICAGDNQRGMGPLLKYPLGVFLLQVCHPSHAGCGQGVDHQHVVGGTACYSQRSRTVFSLCGITLTQHGY